MVKAKIAKSPKRAHSKLNVDYAAIATDKAKECLSDAYDLIA